MWVKDEEKYELTINESDLNEAISFQIDERDYSNCAYTSLTEMES